MRLNSTTIKIWDYKNLKYDQNIILKFKNYCKKKGLIFLLSNNFKLAIKLNLDGAYIPSFNNEINHLNYSLNKKFIIIGSAHNLKEIKTKETQKVDQIVLSSLFKKNKNYLGLYKFKILKKITKKNVIALGGISNNNLKQLTLAKCNSFAGISFFEKKKGP